MFIVLWFQIWIPKLVRSQAWKCIIFKVCSSTEIAVLTLQMCNITVHFNVTWCLLEGNKCSKGAGGKKEATHYCAYFPPEKRSNILGALFSNMFRNTEQNYKQILIFNSSMYHWFARAPQSVLHSVASWTYTQNFTRGAQLSLLASLVKRGEFAQWQMSEEGRRINAFFFK